MPTKTRIKKRPPAKRALAPAPKLNTGNYQIHVKDFGPIGEAKVDLKPLTIFVGPSNTGKSYLAILIYALHQFFGEGVSLLGWRSSNILSNSDMEQLANFFKKSPNRKSLADWIKLVRKREPLPPLPEKFEKLLRSLLSKNKSFEEPLNKESRRCFGIGESQELIRHVTSVSGAEINLSIFPEVKTDSDTKLIRQFINISGNKIHYSSSIPPTIPILHEAGSLMFLAVSFLLEKNLKKNEAFDDMDIVSFLSSMIREIYSFLLGPICQNSFYLPASRTGVMHSHRVVISGLIQGASLDSPSSPILSGVLGDFLDELTDLPKASQRSQNKAEKPWVKQLEQKILKGAIEMKTSATNYPEFFYRPKAWKGEPLPLMRASSMVSELAPVVLYLRYLVNPGDVLIIEEPESHLHPAKQTEFAEFLAGVVRAGVRVILTTHSDIIIEKIGNLVQKSRLPKKKKNGAEKSLSLQPDDVGVWLFKQGKGSQGSQVEKVKMDKETGLYSVGHSEIYEALYDENIQMAEAIEANEERRS